MLSKIRSLLEITDFTVEEIDELVALAMDIIANPKKYADVCKSKKLATLFYEYADAIELYRCDDGARR